MDTVRLIKEAHENAVEKGFYPEGEDKNIGELLMLIVSELGEALEAHRNGRFANKEDIESLCSNICVYDSGIWISMFESQIKDTFEDEIADVFIRLFDLCGYLNYVPDYDWLMGEHISENIGNSLLTISHRVCHIRSDGNTEINTVLADMFKFCDMHKINIEKHIEAKMAYNKTRPHKHEKEY